MKHLKKFETKKPTYKVGDLVVAYGLYFIDQNLKDFLYNNIGEIIKIDTIYGGQINRKSRKRFRIMYENIPNNLKKYFPKNDIDDFEPGNCYTLYTNEFDKATTEEIARAKYNL